MKPRFSILTLLGITAYVAVALAAVSDPLSIWASVTLYLWIGVVASLGMNAATGSPPRAVFATAASVACLAYVAAATFENDVSLVFYSAPPHWTMPHNQIVELIVPQRLTQGAGFGAAFGNPDATARRMTLYRWAVANCSLSFGVSIGLLALWRYRVLERRANQEKSGE